MKLEKLPLSNNDLAIKTMMLNLILFNHNICNNDHGDNIDLMI